MLVSEKKERKKNSHPTLQANTKLYSFHIFLYPNRLYGDNALSEDNSYDNVFREKNAKFYTSPPVIHIVARNINR